MLKGGAMPTLCLPKEKENKVVRNPPKNREFFAKVYFRSFDEMKNISCTLPVGWTKTVKHENVIFEYDDGHDQPKFKTSVLSDFSVSASYYGWSAGLNSPVRQLKIQESSNYTKFFFI